MLWCNGLRRQIRDHDSGGRGLDSRSFKLSCNDSGIWTNKSKNAMVCCINKINKRWPGWMTDLFNESGTGLHGTSSNKGTRWVVIVLIIHKQIYKIKKMCKPLVAKILPLYLLTGVFKLSTFLKHQTKIAVSTLTYTHQSTFIIIIIII